MSNSRIVKNTVILVGQSLLSLIISIFVNGYIARSLGTADYGKFVFAFSFAAMFNVFSDLGLNGWGVKQMAAAPQRTPELLGDIIVARSFYSLVVFFTVCLVITGMDYPLITKQAVYIAAFSVIIAGTQFTNIWIVFEAHEAVKYEGISNLMCRIVIALLSILIMYLDYNILALSFVYLFGSILQVAYCYYILGKRFNYPRFSFSIRKYFRQTKEALPFAFLSLFFVIYYEIDKNMLSWIQGDSAVGLYNAATTVAYRAAIVSSAVAVACMPAMIRYFQESPEKLSRFLSQVMPFLLILGVPIAVLATALSQQIIDFIYRSDAYHPSVLTLQIIIWMVPLEFVSHLFRFALVAASRERVPAIIVAAGTLVNIVLNLFLIPRYSYNGAAVATVVTEMFLVVSMVYFFKNKISPLSLGRNELLVLAANIPLGGLSYYLVQLGFSFWTPLIVAPCYFFILWLLGVLDVEYIRFVREVITRKKAA